MSRKNVELSAAVIVKVQTLSTASGLDPVGALEIASADEEPVILKGFLQRPVLHQYLSIQGGYLCGTM